MTHFDFINVLPDGCIDWLWYNIGAGNYSADRPYFTNTIGCDWTYSRLRKETIRGIENVATVTIHNEEKAVLFALRWANVESI